MGKKAKLKKIRRLASSMPDIKTEQVIGDRVYGYELLKDGIKEVEGKPVDPKEEYYRKKGVPVSVNHNRQMKRMYNKHGLGGVVVYAQAVKRFVQSQNQSNAGTT
jgi:hypothetical protein